MLGSTAFVYGEDSRLKRERTINISLQERRKSDEPQTIREKIYYFFLNNVFITCLSVYGLWTMIGVLFYTYYDGWTGATAYFYAMEAGLSIGFCNPAEINDWSKLFTIFYVLSGSIIISGSVGFFASSLVFNTSPIIRINRQQVLKQKGKFDIAKNAYDASLESTSIFGYLRYIWKNFKYYIGWYSNRFRAIITIVFIVWIGFGTVCGMLIYDWTFITALYWAITTASTGGLYSPPCLGDTSGTNCDIGNTPGIVLGVFMMVGVPVYAFAFGQYARMAVAKTIRAQEEQLLNRPIEDAEFLFAANILSPEGSETLVLGEYILLELMRLGITNKRQIESMKNKFSELDLSGSGEIGLDDLRKEGKVIHRSNTSTTNLNEVHIDI